ncbi:MAG: CsgG/HfaB family protein [Thermocrinis sp.]|jgi:curli biogenesis system outer membrane secretion channel CsgG|uniref:CsgG/HfaB family protein n=1 Tax=Thermocrinis sp. TaxID=2024383 RepID=UPI003C0406B7
MKKSLAIFLVLGAVAQAGDTKTEERQIPVVRCSEPVYSVMVMDFDCKASACQQPNNPKLLPIFEVLTTGSGVQGLGKGVATMLTNALKATNCFRIVDLEQYERMQKLLSATGQKVQPPKVDYMIIGSITALELERSGGPLGGGVVPLLGAISVKKDKAKLAADVNVIKPETLEVAYSKSFSANSEKTSWSLFGGGAAGAFGGAGWSISKNLSLDVVARDVVVQVANALAEELARDKIVERPKLTKEEEKRKQDKQENTDVIN